MGLFLNPRNVRKAAGHLGTLRDNVRIAKEDKRRVAAGEMTHAERERFQMRELAISMGQEPADGTKACFGWNDQTDGVRARQVLINRYEIEWKSRPPNEWMSEDSTRLREKAAHLKCEIARLTGAETDE